MKLNDEQTIFDAYFYQDLTPSFHNHFLIIFQVGFGCPKEQFICKATEKCIPSYLKCDGKDDCGDNSDEEEGCIGNKNYF